jgi:hypothetical protein
MFLKICILHGNIPKPRAHEVARPLRNEVDPKCRWTQGTTELGRLVVIDVKKDYRKIGARGPCLKEENQVKKYVEDQQSNIYLGMHIVGSWNL